MTDRSDTTKYAKVFILIVFIAALISLFFKGISQVTGSHFKHNSYNILFVDDQVRLLHIDRNEKEMVVQKLGEDIRKEITGKTQVQQSLDVGVPLDAVVVAKNESIFNSLDSSFVDKGLAFSLWFSKEGLKTYNLNSYDILKILYYSSSFPKENKQVIGSDEADSRSLEDNLIFNEGLSIKIVNGTGIDGLATRISDILTNAGYNIVSLESENIDRSIITTNDVDSVSAKRLATFFNAPLVLQSEDSITDISVVIGRDKLSEFD